MIVPIVEGHSEIQSVPILLRRLVHERERFDVQIGTLIRVKRNQIVRAEEIERTVALARATRAGCRALMLILDADDDCPKELAPDLLERGRNASDVPFFVVLAKSEFEAWFLGSLESLRGVRGIVEGAVSPDTPEEIRGANERLSEQMIGTRRYVETDDQPALADQFDLDAARQRCPSFDKFVRDVDAILAIL